MKVSISDKVEWYVDTEPYVNMGKKSQSNIHITQIFCGCYIRTNSTLPTGEFGVVYRARLGSKGQEVAIKTLKGFSASSILHELPFAEKKLVFLQGFLINEK